VAKRCAFKCFQLLSPRPIAQPLAPISKNFRKAGKGFLGTAFSKTSQQLPLLYFYTFFSNLPKKCLLREWIYKQDEIDILYKSADNTPIVG